MQPPELTVRADGQRLEQALQNLAANSLRHTPEGGRLSLVAEKTREGTRLVVRDNGPGIQPEHLPHIFERFYKADAARSATKMSGSGLGLSIVQAIVERHGGRIAASNAPGGRSRFRDHDSGNQRAADRTAPPDVRLTFRRIASPLRTRP